MMYFCGLDGGGTKTALCAIDRSGKTVAEAEFGPFNLNGATAETVHATVSDIVSFMRNRLPSGLRGCGYLTVGMAGISNKNAVCFAESSFSQAGYDGHLQLVGDQEIALNGAIDGPGAVLIAGTGSVCCGRDVSGRIYRTGGYGYLIDDVGSGYAIGRDILTAVVRAADHRLPETELTGEVYKALGITDIPSLITWLYAPTTGKKQIAALAPLLISALDRSDEAALEIAAHAASDLAELVFAFWRQSGLSGGELALAGGILQHYRVIADRLTADVRRQLPQVDVHPPYHTPAYGAAKIALCQAGCR